MHSHLLVLAVGLGLLVGLNADQEDEGSQEGDGPATNGVAPTNERTQFKSTIQETPQVRVTEPYQKEKPKS